MKALILNSGIGKRMGILTQDKPKCMAELQPNMTLIKLQLMHLSDAGIREVVITTGPFAKLLECYVRENFPDMNFTFVNNPLYESTNYIYSIALAREALMDDDIILMHGDLVFELSVLKDILAIETSAMVVDSTLPLPEKDFKAVLDGDRVKAVGIEFFGNAVAAQPLYKLNRADWLVWLDAITAFCGEGNRKVYAENALNTVSGSMQLYRFDVKGRVCTEVDDAQDLEKCRKLSSRLFLEPAPKTVYMCMSTDIIHNGHIRIIARAAELGELTIGVLTDEAVSQYKRFPLVPYDERVQIISSIKGVSHVVKQNSLDYTENLIKYEPDIVVHGDDWVTGSQQATRKQVIDTLVAYGGRLVEFPYTHSETAEALEENSRRVLAMPERRRRRLKQLLALKKPVSVMEAHNGLTGLIVENTRVERDGVIRQFDAMWISSLCDSTAKGKPDIELVDFTSRMRTIDEIMDVTTKPIIIDGDTGGLTEHFRFFVKTLERVGVSAVIIEDKTGLKKNSLFGTEVEQTQDTIENFCEKIRAGKSELMTSEFMIIARIESLILEAGMEDALTRARAYAAAGADGIMIHSRKKSPDEIFEFCRRFRLEDANTPIVVVPTTFNMVTEAEFAEHGVNIVIYANQLIRSAFPAMQRTATMILENERCMEADKECCIPIKEIITLIPESK